MYTNRNPNRGDASRHGFVLLAVLVFILLLSMIAVSLLFRSQADESAGHAISGGEQAWSAAMSGVQEAMRVAAAAPPGSTDWQDDPNLFRGREVYQDGGERWFFTIFSPAESGSLVDVRYGLSDEASRLNLNHLGDADLTKIPGLTPALAATLRQFIGETAASADVSEGTNALDETLALLDPGSPEMTETTSTNEVPYHGPLATLEELLLAPGFSRALLHGAPSSGDAELVSPIPEEASEAPADNFQPKRNRGLDQYFTVFSRDPNRSNAGQSRFNLNATNSSWPASAELPASFSNYVAVARAANHQFEHCCEALEATVKGKDSQGVEIEASSGITKENLPPLLDLFTADAEAGHDGLVNVNTASAAVLSTLPGIDLALAEAIVSTRTGMSPERRATTAWLYQEGLVDGAKFKEIASNLTARSSQFRFTVVGYGQPSGRYRVLEVVIDLAAGDPHIIYLRDVTRQGLPIDLKGEDQDSLDLFATVTQSGSLAWVRVQNPKAEGRNPKEIRRPKSESRSSPSAGATRVTGPQSWASIGRLSSVSPARNSFEFRISAFFRPSGFGARPWADVLLQSNQALMSVHHRNEDRCFLHPHG